MMLLARSLRSRLRPPLAVGAAPFSSAAAAEAERAVRDGPRNDWTRPEIQAIYDSPLLDLLFHGVRTHALAPPKPPSFLLSSPVPSW
jgi:biotin synthase